MSKVSTFKKVNRVINNLKNGDILTNIYGRTCVFTVNNAGVTWMEDIDICQQINGADIATYIKKHKLKVTDNTDNYIDPGIEGEENV
ncbi:hypothetical protein [Virgibacillus siamensis]|uniref:hypothetical protein n=1 Tax=Virgibacillus siamensis TaxID=480071 RepID=UPI000986F315|nr:hypothetical protein [Virgibacillus siamensis]